MASNEDVGDTDYGIPAHIISKNKKDQIRIGLNEYKGRQYLDVRQFYLAGENDWKPTGKGITMPVDLYPELLRGVLLLGDMIGADVNSILDAEDKE
jgi:hypothetical protein